MIEEDFVELSWKKHWIAVLRLSVFIIIIRVICVQLYLMAE